MVGLTSIFGNGDADSGDDDTAEQADDAPAADAASPIGASDDPLGLHTDGDGLLGTLTHSADTPEDGQT